MSGSILEDDFLYDYTKIPKIDENNNLTNIA